MALLRIGSRGSQLALWQAHHISALLRERGHEIELEIIKTTGDKIQDVALAKVGTKVQIRTAAGGTVEGVMAAAEPVPDANPRRIAVTVTVADQTALGDTETVDVVVVRAQKQDVLTVPIVALLAVGDGYGLEVTTGGGRRIVPVTVGLFAQGRVEVSAPGLTEGTLVGVAAQ